MADATVLAHDQPRAGHLRYVAAASELREAADAGAEGVRAGGVFVKGPPNYHIERNENGRPVMLSWSAAMDRAIQEKLDAERRERELNLERFRAPMASYRDWCKARGLPTGPDQ